MSRQRKGPPVAAEEQLHVVSVLAGEMTMAEAARRHGVSNVTVQKWRDRFLAGGRQALLEERMPGSTPRTGESVAERRMRQENEQLKLALAEATVQLRIWKKGAEHAEEVPSKTSRR